ncbi:MULTISPECIES: co-chaperone GroES [Peptoniphilus]|uniref:Co-chaperonin GroES n=1 Tax=Peptoniphilus duerdenii ATCC BAA-1640 TaxID=862517 RepID=E0NJN2_9FIRM|nr:MULTISPECIES: co-chaperone GroES [Peptoniphilus]EFM26052.1 chaperonin GroS [Peptoniphilus duerdenii ATCC BAA-1640]ERT62618.1 chaperonin GroS [Peptoniphilus sp. BV3AC2]MDK8276211.1 co-chaperone GroES [Peptoniphilus duerdenii]
MELKPLGDKVVIKKIELEEKTVSGIVLPSSAKEETNIAEVIAIGREILDDDKTKDEIKVGDKVLFSKYAGTEVELEREKFIVLKYQDLLAVVK